ncbi:MAG: GIY-YIG nuclease family protein [Bacteroidia bacterium]|nr:GIY-YIG nuclease family protein [Bacteroidia bacterium]
MPFIVYILYSESSDKYYTGHTEFQENRIFRHNNSGSRSTKHAKDWELKYKEEFPTRSEAMKREREIKKKKSRKYIERIIGQAG